MRSLFLNIYLYRKVIECISKGTDHIVEREREKKRKKRGSFSKVGKITMVYTNQNKILTYISDLPNRSILFNAHNNPNKYRTFILGEDHSYIILKNINYQHQHWSLTTSLMWGGGTPTFRFNEFSFLYSQFSSQGSSIPPLGCIQGSFNTNVTSIMLKENVNIQLHMLITMVSLQWWM